MFEVAYANRKQFSIQTRLDGLRLLEKKGFLVCRLVNPCTEREAYEPVSRADLDAQWGSLLRLDSDDKATYRAIRGTWDAYYLMCKPGRRSQEGNGIAAVISPEWQYKGKECHKVEWRLSLALNYCHVDDLLPLEAMRLIEVVQQ